MKTLLFAIASLVLIGCIHKPFQPVPDEWTLWVKADVNNENDLEKIMLECGANLFADLDLNADRKLMIASGVLYDRCMEKEGFHYKGEMGTTCSRYPSTPECNLPIEQIPSRDIRKRLNSVFCQKKYPNAEICRP